MHALLLNLKVFLVLKRSGRKASLASVVSAKVEVSGVAMGRKLIGLSYTIIALYPKICWISSYFSGVGSMIVTLLNNSERRCLVGCYCCVRSKIPLSYIGGS